MMKSISIVVIFVCYLVVLVSSQPNPPTIRQTRTGQVVKSKPEWKVEITNTEACTFLNLKLSTIPENFAPVAPIDPSILRKDETDKYWILNNGEPLYGSKSFGFTYAGDFVKFSVADYTIACSV
ncbi:hypothetical protein CASFOL_022355 [Castilleja foliolosa]|uniref:Uncharacterized protein n=1 Tax=Castilleja foliolosa TaxID=1961234 RepID=A0ABD3CUB6_9LAMI